MALNFRRKNRRLTFKSVANHGSAPGKATTEGYQQKQVPPLKQSRIASFYHGERNGGGGGIPSSLNVIEEPLGGQAKTLPHHLHDLATTRL